ncbi:MAG: ABC transporter permease [Spirochaetales bacterium]|nr:ABC transporter permease [Spirochaetales bacterium]
MKAFILHFIFETKSGFRKKQQLFLNYFFPLGFFLMMGAIMPQLNPLFLDDMIPAMLIFSVMASTFLGIPDPIVNDRTSGIYRGYRVNRVPSIFLISLPVLSSVIHMLIMSTVILILSPLLFGAPFPASILPILPLLLLTVFCCAGISVLIGVISTSTRAATMLSQVFFIPSMIIGGLMIPYKMLPPSVQPFALFLPSTHSMNLFKTFMYQTEASISPAVSIAVLTGTGTAALILSLIFFRWDNRKDNS